MTKEIVHVCSKIFLKYTADCSKLLFVDEGGSMLKAAELLSLESKGFLDQQTFLVYQEDLSSEVLDGIQASMEKCSVEVSFCDDKLKHRESAVVQPTGGDSYENEIHKH